MHSPIPDTQRGAPVACRLSSYAPHAGPPVYAHLAALGIRYVEVKLVAGTHVGVLERELAARGLAAITVQAQLDLSRDDTAEQLTAQADDIARLRARHVLLAASAGAVPRVDAYRRLRLAGDAATQLGLTLLLETHPDLVTNADVGLATMAGVNQPSVRINFDTANIGYYNDERDPVAELRRLLPFVAGVHLKDTPGGRGVRLFPPLGRGVVDFSAVFGVLDAAGFSGPCTIELEGPPGRPRSFEQACADVAASVAYLRGLGRL